MKAQDLKNSILQLAIQGRLVAQDTNDEPAEVLYAKIQAEKQKLIKEGKIKKDKPLPPITDDEIPVEIPSTWKWVRLGDMCLNIFCGKSPKYSVVETPHKIIGQQANQDDGLDFKYIKYGTSAFVKDMPEMYYLKNYDVLLNTLGGGTIGRSGMYVSNKYEKLLTDGHLFVFRLLDIPTSIYLLFYLKLKRSEIERNANGSTNQTFLNLGETKQWLIPLPPLAEQKRIVARIEELEPFVKQYDKAETELSVLNGSFPEQLKKSILQYAIQGKLVAQDDNDEPAEVLYAKIQAEKQRLIKEGKIKKDKPLPPITDDEIPFEIPPSWKWVRLGDIVRILNGYAFQSTNYVFSSKNQLIRLGNVKNGEIILNEKIIYISEEDAKKAQDFKILDNDILVTLTGTRYKRDYFYTAVYHKNEDDNALYLNQRVGLFRVYNNLIDANLLAIMLRNKYLLDAIFATETGTVNQGNIGTGNVAKLLLPLPPLAEQKRIVAKVNDLMQYCEELKCNK